MKLLPIKIVSQCGNISSQLNYSWMSCHFEDVSIFVENVSSATAD